MFASRCEIIEVLSGTDSKLGRRITTKLLCIALLTAVLSTAGFAAEPWRFIVTCDSRGRDDGIEKTVLRELVAEITSNKADFVLFSGDLVSGHTASDPAQFEAQLRVWLEEMKPDYDDGIGVYI